MQYSEYKSILFFLVFAISSLAWMTIISPFGRAATGSTCRWYLGSIQKWIQQSIKWTPPLRKPLATKKTILGNKLVLPFLTQRGKCCVIGERRQQKPVPLLFYFSIYRAQLCILKIWINVKHRQKQYMAISQWIFQKILKIKSQKNRGTISTLAQFVPPSLSDTRLLFLILDDGLVIKQPLCNVF